MVRDPRTKPKPGDCLDDDPPLPPLIVHAVTTTTVRAARYAHATSGTCECDPSNPNHPHACDCLGCICTADCSWPIDAWQREMRDAVVLRHAPKASGTPRVTKAPKAAAK